MKTKHVLIVEDNIDNRGIFRTILEHRGYRVSEAETGEEGLRLVREDRPDLVLLDIGLPGMDGWAVAERMREDETLNGTAILVVTASRSVDGNGRAIELGCEDYLTKPIGPRELADHVKSCIGAPTAV